VFDIFWAKQFCCPILTSYLSGSPVIQNGKLVGAVTHVFVNDPTRGYGVFIEKCWLRQRNLNNGKARLF